MKPVLKMYVSLMKHRFSVLLIALAAMLIAVPVFRSLFPTENSGFLVKLTAVLFLLIFLSALFAVSRTRLTMVISVCLLLGNVMSDTLFAVFNFKSAAVAGNALGVLFLGWCTVLIVARIFKKETITFDTIAASLCAYLLMALTWGVLYTLIERIHPGSFIYASDPAADLISQHALTVYFSFVVLSTLGLGDILPVTSNVRMLVASEAVMGQIYLAVLVARLVGMHISSNQSCDRS